MLGIAAALSHGGVIVAWWRRLPPLRSVLWLLASFLVLSASAAVIAHLGTAAALGVAAVTGMVNARAWYGLAGIAARMHPRTPASVPAKVLFGLPFAPIAALMTLALVVGMARLMFTGTIQLPIGTPSPAAAANALSGGTAHAGTTAATATPATTTAAAGAAVLVVSGWGSSCCDAANGLRATMPGADVRQFSYVGLDSRDFPLRHGPSADDLPLPVLGDRIAAQLEVLHNQTHRPVDVVAESEGTLGVYAMLEPPPRPPDRLRGAAQPDRRPRPGQLPVGTGRRLGVRGSPERAEPPGRRDVTVRARAAPSTCSARSASSAPGTSTR